jgi:hypothetical protein
MYFARFVRNARIAGSVEECIDNNPTPQEVEYSSAKTTRG